MVNILKHMKKDKNPFIKFLKEFTDYDEETLGIVKDVSESEGYLSTDLEEGKSIVINDSSILLINPNYSSVGCFKIPIDELFNESGNISFITNSDEENEGYDIVIFFSSKEELYKLINGWDSLNSEHKMKELLFLMENFGIMNNRTL